MVLEFLGHAPVTPQPLVYVSLHKYSLAFKPFQTFGGYKWKMGANMPSVEVMKN
jgi:hypothetical protein